MDQVLAVHTRQKQVDINLIHKFVTCMHGTRTGFSINYYPYSWQGCGAFCELHCCSGNFKLLIKPWIVINHMQPPPYALHECTPRSKVVQILVGIRSLLFFLCLIMMFILSLSNFLMCWCLIQLSVCMICMPLCWVCFETEYSYSSCYWTTVIYLCSNNSCSQLNHAVVYTLCNR